ASTAASPLPASATTSISGSTFREAESPIRTMKWSSTTRIRIGFEVFIRERRFVERNVYCDGRPVSWLALDLESGSHRLSPLAHIQQTKVSDAGYFAGREALAIVTDAETDASRAINELYPNLLSLAVLYGIGNSFLANAKQVHLDRTRQTCGFATDLYFGFDLTVGRERLHNFSQSRNQAAILQQMTAYVPDGAAGLHHAVAAHPAGSVQRLARNARRFLKTIGGKIELHGDAREFLFERVVEFTGDAVAFCKDRATAQLLTDDCHLLAQTATKYHYPSDDQQKYRRRDPEKPHRVAQIPPGGSAQNRYVLRGPQQYAERLGYRPQTAAAHQKNATNPDVAVQRHGKHGIIGRGRGQAGLKHVLTRAEQ